MISRQRGKMQVSVSSVGQNTRVSAEGLGLCWGQKRALSAQKDPWGSAEPISSCGENTAY